jgi:peptidoglycan/LPS O-acetylase OafA/YrhL
MPEEARRRDQLLGLFVLGLALFNPPLLYLFSGGTVFGWPLLYVYIFVVWALVIAIVAIVVSRRRRRADQFEIED